MSVGILKAPMGCTFIHVQSCKFCGYYSYYMSMKFLIAITCLSWSRKRYKLPSFPNFLVRKFQMGMWLIIIRFTKFNTHLSFVLDCNCF